MDAALAALRAATGPAQRALEASPLPVRVSSSGVTLDDYRAWLEAQRAVLVPWCEEYPLEMRRACRCEPCSRLEALHLDLAELHSGMPDARRGDDGARLDWAPDSPAWWGGLYVIENARLGARGLARHLRRQLGVCVAGALRFLEPANEGNQPAWSSLLQVIERALPPEKRAAAIEGALQVLARYQAAYERAAGPAPRDGTREDAAAA